MRFTILLYCEKAKNGSEFIQRFKDTMAKRDVSNALSLSLTVSHKTRLLPFQLLLPLQLLCPQSLQKQEICELNDPVNIL